MALYGNDMIDVQLDDGRRLTVPAQLAANYPGMRPVQQPAPMAPELGGQGMPPGALAPQPPGAPAMIGAAPGMGGPPGASAPPPEETPQRAQPAPLTAPTSPVLTPQDQADLAARTKAATPPPAAPPQPKPVTNADLAKGGAAATFNLERAAQEGQKAAALEAGRVDADEATKIGNAMALRDEESQRILQERAKVAADNQKRLDTKMAEYERNAKALSETKIDRSDDHPIMTLIGVILAGIGASRDGKGGNVALDMLSKKIDQKVAAQMAQIDLRQKGLATQRDMLNVEGERGRDRLAEIDQRTIAAFTQAKQKIETIKAQSGSPRAQANADMAVAAIDEKIAARYGEASQREQQRIDKEQTRKDALQMHRDSIGVQYAGQREQRRHNLASEADARTARADAAKEALAKGDAAAAKLIMERGISGEVTTITDKDGKPLKNEDGTVQTKTGLITMKNGEPWIPKGTESVVADLQKKHPAVTAYVETLDELRKLGPEFLTGAMNSDKKQRMDQIMGTLRLQAIAVNNLGVPTGKDIDLAENFIGTSDPTRWRSSLAGLQQSRDTVVRNHNAVLRSAGLDKPWNPVDIGKKGPVEQAGDATLKSLSANPDRDFSITQWQEELGGNPAGNSADPKAQQARAGYAAAGYMMPSQRRDLDSLGKAAIGQDPEKRKLALNILENTVNGGGNEAIKAYAQQLLTNAATVTTSTEDTARPSARSVANDTLSAPPLAQPAPTKPVRRDSAGNPL